MKKFFFRLFLLLFFAALGYALFLAAPFGLFFYSFQALNDTDEAFAFELNPLSGILVLEDSSPAEAEAALVANQTLTYAMSDDELATMLSAYLATRAMPGFALDSLKVMIAPEMLSLEISWQCELLGYRFYKNSVFSEWLLRVSGSGDTRHIEVKPNDLHSNHLYSVNLADYWAHSPWIDDPDGWSALTSTSGLNVQQLVLQDGEISLTLGMTSNTEL